MTSTPTCRSQHQNTERSAKRAKFRNWLMEVSLGDERCWQTGAMLKPATGILTKQQTVQPARMCMCVCVFASPPPLNKSEFHCGEVALLSKTLQIFWSCPAMYDCRYCLRWCWVWVIIVGGVYWFTGLCICVCHFDWRSLTTILSTS